MKSRRCLLLVLVGLLAGCATNEVAPKRPAMFRETTPVRKILAVYPLAAPLVMLDEAWVETFATTLQEGLDAKDVSSVALHYALLDKNASDIFRDAVRTHQPSHVLTHGPDKDWRNTGSGQLKNPVQSMVFTLREASSGKVVWTTKGHLATPRNAAELATKLIERMQSDGLLR